MINKEGRKVVAIVLSQAFLPGGGGKEVSIHNISQEIAKQGIADVEIVCFEMGDKKIIEEFDQNYDLPIFRIKSRLINSGLNKKLNAKFNSLVGGLKKLNFIGRVSMVIRGTVIPLVMLRTVINRIRHHKDSKIILHCHSLVSAFVAVCCKNIFFRKQKIAILFTNGFVYKKSGFGIVDKVIKKVLQKVDLSLCISKASARSLVSEFELREENVKSYDYWINLKNLDLGSDFKNITRKKRILFVGRIVPEKGISEIIKLADSIEKKGLVDDYLITVIGDSNHPVKEVLEVRSEKLECLEYLGRINKPQLWKYYFNSDIFLMPSTWEEGSGNVILEAYAFGLPVIGSNKGGIPEVLEKFKYRKILGSLEPETILNSIQELVSQIRELSRQEIYNESRKTISKYFSNKNFEVYRQSYEYLIEKL